MFNPQKFTKRYTKVILGGIVAVMAVSLVLWIPGAGPGDGERGGELEGRLYGSVPIYTRDFMKAEVESYVYQAWTIYQKNMQKLAMLLYTGEPPPELKDRSDADRRKQTWEYLVLLEEANRQQVVATTEEAAARIRRFFMPFLRERLEEQYDEYVNGIFRVSVPVFEETMVKVTRIEKLLELMTESDFVSYDKVSQKVLEESRLVRVKVAGFEPKDFQKFLSPVTPVEIKKYFDENPDKFKEPERVQVEYAMVPWEEFKKEVPSPAEEQLKRYYQDNQKEFPAATAKPEASPGHEGHDHEAEKPQETEYKKFEEVRAEIFDKLVAIEAKKLARAVIDRIDYDLGQKLATVEPKDLTFDSLLQPHLPLGKKIAHGVTQTFERRVTPDVEKLENLGANTGLAGWAFEKKTKVHDFSRLMTTDKGYVLFQLRNRNEGGKPVLTRHVEEKITKELLRQQVQKRARKEAEKLQKLVEQRRDLASAGAALRVTFESSKYFPPSGYDPVGLSDESLGREVREWLRPYDYDGKPKDVTVAPGSAAVFDVDGAGGGKKSYFVYLEDVVTSLDKDWEAKFSSQYRSENEKWRKERRSKVVEVFRGGYEDLRSAGTKRS